MRLSRQIAIEQVRWWRANGVSAADAMESLGYAVGRQRHIGRSWAEIIGYVERTWIDARVWDRMKEAA